MEKYNLIVSAEEQFAREVTLGAIVARPPSAWSYLIPGMFIIDFLRRGSAIRKYTQHFMFPRKLAVDAARAVSQGEDEADAEPHSPQVIARIGLDHEQLHIERHGVPSTARVEHEAEQGAIGEEDDNQGDNGHH